MILWTFIVFGIQPKVKFFTNSPNAPLRPSMPDVWIRKKGAGDVSFENRLCWYSKREIKKTILFFCNKVSQKDDSMMN